MLATPFVTGVIGHALGIIMEFTHWGDVIKLGRTAQRMGFNVIVVNLFSVWYCMSSRTTRSSMSRKDDLLLCFIQLTFQGNGHRKCLLSDS